MKPEIKKMWINALRSGEYTQARGKLHKSCGSFCALGVLVDLAVQEGICEWGENDSCSENQIIYDDNIGYYEVLPQCVVDWAGLDSPNPKVNDEEDYNSITWINDEKQYSFPLIASIIQEQL